MYASIVPKIGCFAGPGIALMSSHARNESLCFWRGGKSAARNVAMKIESNIKSIKRNSVITNRTGGRLSTEAKALRARFAFHSALFRRRFKPSTALQRDNKAKHNCDGNMSKLDCEKGSASDCRSLTGINQASAL